MAELMLAIAMWCGPPGRPAVGLTMSVTGNHAAAQEIETCRAELMTCMVDSSVGDKKIFECFQKQKLVKG